MYDYDTDSNANDFYPEPTDAQDLDFDPTQDNMDEYSAEPEEGYQMTDVEADADTLASAGYGTDEDYGCYNSGDEGGF